MKNNQFLKGFSLIEILITVAIAGVVISIFSVLMIQLTENQKRLELYSNFQNEIGTGLKLMSNPLYVGKIIGLYPPNTPLFLDPASPTPTVINQALLRCLSSDQTSGCVTFQTPNFIDVPSETNPANGVTRKSGLRELCNLSSPPNTNCPIIRRLSYQLICDNSRCRSLNLKLIGELDPQIDTINPDFRKKFFMRRVEHNISFNSVLLTSQSTIESTCGAAPAREIDFSRRSLSGCHAGGGGITGVGAFQSSLLFKNNPIEAPTFTCTDPKGCPINSIYEASCGTGFKTVGILSSSCFNK